MRITELVNLLCNKGVLNLLGNGGLNILFNSYSSFLETTSIERKGHLFLGRYLGADIIANQIAHNLAYITGKTSNGDEAVGTGILVTNKLVLTCAHVLTDMQVDNELEIYHTKYEILEHVADSNVDIGIIILKNEVADGFHKDIALRKSVTLEKVVISGFPKIPLNLNKTRNPVTQSGEIASRISTYDGHKLELFTSIARPGDSGGPVMSLDGKVLGLVTNSLERKIEDSDFDIQPMPFFASVPADMIIKSFNKMKLEKKWAKEFSLPWENFE